MATPFLQAACLPPRRERVQTMRRVLRVSPLPDYASSASAQMIQHRLGDFESHAEALQPCRKRPAQVVQPPAGKHRMRCRAPTSLSTSAKGRSALAGEDERQLRKVVRARIISDEPAMCVLNARQTCLDKKAKNPFGIGTSQLSCQLSMSR